MLRPVRMWLREPLVHFVLAGAALLVVHQAVAPPPPQPANHIAFGSAAIEQVRQGIQTRLGREPTATELELAIDEAVDREILFREARALDLGRADPVVRRRLIQKMTFVLEDAAALTPPTNATLSEFLREHGEHYRQPPRTALTHVFLAQGRHENARELAERLLAELRGPQPPDPASLGEAFTHGHRFGPRSEAGIEAVLGTQIARHVQTQEPDQWAILASPFGLHIVRVDAQLPGKIPPLAEIRATLVEDWLEQQKSRRRREALRERRSHYTVEVFHPPSGAS
ncbi:MAG: peptidyl-prolyl cis-trans isomerase [Nannocystaceae bacterium]